MKVKIFKDRVNKANKSHLKKILMVKPRIIMGKIRVTIIITKKVSIEIRGIKEIAIAAKAVPKAVGTIEVLPMAKEVATKTIIEGGTDNAAIEMRIIRRLRSTTRRRKRAGLSESSLRQISLSQPLVPARMRIINKIMREVVAVAVAAVETDRIIEGVEM